MLLRPGRARPKDLVSATATTCSAFILILFLAMSRAASAAETNSASSTDFKSFQAIIDHNIFDPNRRSGRPRDQGPTIAPRQSDSFTLLGTAQGNLAVFTGTRSDFRKNAKPGDTIAGYRIEEIAHNYVKLGAASNKTINLPMLTQMRRQGDGPWSIGPRGESTEAPAPEAPPAASPSNETKSAETSTASSKSDAISDVMKRLMQKHDADNK
ncbi:MAG TPA: hypothetical protein VN281_21030 [Verrucomicrobiae bacterium]|nr:hypothetical protein [Verrucomicrobiae bacterium]